MVEEVPGGQFAWPEEEKSAAVDWMERQRQGEDDDVRKIEIFCSDSTHVCSAFVCLLLRSSSLKSWDVECRPASVSVCLLQSAALTA